MTQQNNLIIQPINWPSLGKRMLLGASIGLAVILFFVLGVDEPNPEWGKLWMIRPLLVTPSAGAMGGAFYYFMNHITYKGSWKRVLANIVSVIVFIIGIWMGIVLGLVGTMWH